MASLAALKESADRSMEVLVGACPFWTFVPGAQGLEGGVPDYEQYPGPLNRFANYLTDAATA